MLMQADAKEKILDLACGNERIREKSAILLYTNEKT